MKMDHTRKRWGLFSLSKLNCFREESVEHHDDDERRWGDLPDGIIDHIQSFLPGGDAVRSSVLCKSWLHAYSTSPTLKFQQLLFLDEQTSSKGGRNINWKQTFAKLFTKSNSRMEETINGKQKFAEYLGNTLARYHHHGLPIQTLHLSVSLFYSEDKELVSLVRRSFEIAKERGLVNLYAKMSGILGELIDPIEIFSCKTLEEITLDFSLCHIFFKIPRAYNQDCSMIGCHSLRKLELREVDIPQEVIHGLFSGCPLIEDVILNGCTGFRNLMVSSDILHCLRSFEIITYAIDQTIDIDSSTLRSFVGRCSYQLPLFTSFRVDASWNLTTLYLGGVVVTNSEFSRFISKFPLLEYLRLECCYSLEKIDIKSDHLHTLKLMCWSDLREVKLDTPNLVVLSLEGDANINIASISQIKGINSPRVKSDLAFEVDDRFDHSLLLQLRDKVLEISLGARLSINLRSEGISPDINLDVLRGKRALCSNVVETLLLNCKNSLCPDTHSTILDALFSICRPKYLCLTYDWCFEDDGFFRFVCEELTEKTYPLRCFCSTTDDQIFRCWRHDLNGVKEIDYLYAPDCSEDDPYYKPVEVPWRSLFDGSVEVDCFHVRLKLDWNF